MIITGYYRRDNFYEFAVPEQSLVPIEQFSIKTFQTLWGKY